MAIDIRYLTSKDDEEYTDFLNREGKDNPSVLGYHFPFYRDMLVSLGIGEPFYAGAFENERLIAALPGFIKKNSEGAVYCSLPFFGPNAGIIYDHLCSDRNGVHLQIFEFLFENLQKLDILTASVYSPFLAEENYDYRNYLGEVTIVEKFTCYLTIPDAKWSAKIDYDIRKSLQNGVQISNDITEERILSLYRIYEKNCIDYSIPIKPFECIEYLMKKNTENDDHVKTYFAIHDGIVIGGLIVLWGPITASYYLPCSIHEFRSYQPTTLLIDHAFKDAKENGLKYWNWESSQSIDSGVFQFKKKWGSINSEYKIFIKSFVGVDRLKSIGVEKISMLYPNFFVFPFNKISN